MKKLTALLLAIILIAPVACIDAQACTDVTGEDVSMLIERIEAVYSKGYEEGSMTLTSIKDAAVLCGLSAATDSGAICIFERMGGGYVVTLGGTEVTNSDENIGIKEDIQSAFNQSSAYKTNAINAITATVPAGEDVYIYGYSLGGMVMQQVLADGQIKENYNIRTAVAIGSPVTSISRRKILFIEDTNDLVPTMSAKSFLAGRLFRKYDTHIVRDGGYKTTAGGHALSYVDSDVWNDIDPYGTLSGGVMEINISTMKTFYA